MIINITNKKNVYMPAGAVINYKDSLVNNDHDYCNFMSNKKIENAIINLSNNDLFNIAINELSSGYDLFADLKRVPKEVRIKYFNKIKLLTSLAFYALEVRNINSYFKKTDFITITDTYTKEDSSKYWENWAIGGTIPQEKILYKSWILNNNKRLGH